MAPGGHCRAFWFWLRPGNIMDASWLCLFFFHSSSPCGFPVEHSINKDTCPIPNPVLPLGKLYISAEISVSGPHPQYCYSSLISVYWKIGSLIISPSLPPLISPLFHPRSPLFCGMSISLPLLLPSLPFSPFFFKTMLLIQLSPLCFSSIFSQIIPVFWSLANLSYSAVISKGSLNTLLTDLAGISNGKGWWSNYEITILPLKIYSPEFLPLSFLL